jgi:hypothetical protein
VNSKLKVTSDKQVNMVRHDLYLNEFLPHSSICSVMITCSRISIGGESTLRLYLEQNIT